MSSWGFWARWPFPRAGLNLYYPPGMTQAGVSRSNPLLGLLIFALVFLRFSLLNPLFLIFVIFPVVLVVVSYIYMSFFREKFELVSRVVPEICREGERLKVLMTFKYKGVLPFTYALARDTFLATDILEGPEIMISPPFGEENISFSYEVEANRGYGDFIVGPLLLKVFDPIGIFSEEIRIEGENRLKVLIQPPTNEELNLVKENSLTPLGDSRARKPGQSLEFFGINEYRPGSDFRHICWKKLAQLGILVVKEFEFDARSEVMVVLNTEAGKIKGLSFGSNIKKAIRVASGLLEASFSNRLKTTLVVPVDEEPRVLTISPSFQNQIFALDFLARIQGSDEVSFPALIDLAGGYVNPSTVLFVVSHTLDFNFEEVLNRLLDAASKKARVCFLTVDDSEMVKYSSFEGNNISTVEFASRLQELSIDFRVLKESGVKEPLIAGTRRQETKRKSDLNHKAHREHKGT